MPNNPIIYNDDIVEFDPRVIPTGGQKGAILKYGPNVGTAIILVKQDDGVTTNWSPVAGGGAPTGTANTNAYFDGGGNLASNGFMAAYASERTFINTRQATAAAAFPVVPILSLISAQIQLGDIVNIAPTDSYIFGMFDSQTPGANIQIESFSHVMGQIAGQATISRAAVFGSISSTVFLIDGTYAKFSGSTSNSNVNIGSSASVNNGNVVDSDFTNVGSSGSRLSFLVQATSTVLVSDSSGSSLHGNLDSGSTFSMTDSPGAKISGNAFNNSIVQIQNAAGAHIGGRFNTANLAVSGPGSIFHGSIATSTVAISGTGSVVQGNFNGAGVINITGSGVIALGATAGGGGMDASATGILMGGYFVSGGLCRGNGTGSFLWGVATNGFNLESTAGGAWIGGFAVTGNVTVIGGVNAGLAYGDDIEVSAEYSQAFGVGHRQNVPHSFVSGRYSESLTPALDNTDPCFRVGAGSAPGPATEFDAIRVDKDGRMTNRASIRNTAIRNTNGNVTVDARLDHTIILEDNSAGAFVITLPTPEDGLEFRFALGVTTNSDWTFDAATNGGTLTPYVTSVGSGGSDYQALVCLGTVWHRIA